MLMDLQGGGGGLALYCCCLFLFIFIFPPLSLFTLPRRFWKDSGTQLSFLISNPAPSSQTEDHLILTDVNNNIDHGTHQMNEKIPNSSDDKKLLWRTNIIITWNS